MSTEFEHFCKWANTALTEHHIHSAVQNRLAHLLAQEFPDNPSIAEVFAVKGGRNDLIHYDQQGRLAVFELFCSTSRKTFTALAEAARAKA